MPLHDLRRRDGVHEHVGDREQREGGVHHHQEGDPVEGADLEPRAIAKAPLLTCRTVTRVPQRTEYAKVVLVYGGAYCVYGAAEPRQFLFYTVSLFPF